MTDNVEQRLRQLTPRGCDPALRTRVLAKLGDELFAFGGRGDDNGDEPSQNAAFAPASTLSRYSRHIMYSAATLLVVAAALNVWVHRSMNRRLAVAFGPPPVRQQAAEVAATVASVTDPQTGRWAYLRLSPSPPKGFALLQNADRIQAIYRQLSLEIQDHAQDTNSHETNQKNSQMDGPLRRRDDLSIAAAQCLVRLEHRDAA